MVTERSCSTPQALPLRLVERLHERASLRDLLLARCEGAVARLELLGVDDRLAVEAEVLGLPALGLEPVGVVEVVEHAVEDDAARSTRREQAPGDRR
jgi:hypothetical protein